jgi:anti-anti-sigma regulatory factor
MNVLENLISDLREKRLWPIAAALIVAIIAVPLLLSGAGNSSVPVAQVPGAGAASAPVPSLPAVSVTGTPSNARLTGSKRDPFSQQVKPSTGTTTPGSSTGGATTSSRAGSPAPSSPSSSASTSKSTTSTTKTTSTTSTPTSTSTTPASTTPAAKYNYFQVGLVYGGTGSVPQTLANPARLTPLPKASDPLIVYLGVMNDHKTALFLLSADVHVTGKGKCLPSRSNCQLLELQSGEADLFKAVRASGTTTFTLSLTSVKTFSTASASVAAAAHERVSKAGSKIVARATKRSIALHGLTYSKQSGTLSIHLTLASLKHLVRRMGIEAALGVTLQPIPAGS